MCVDQFDARHTIVSWSLFLLGVFVPIASHFVLSYASTHPAYDVVHRQSCEFSLPLCQDDIQQEGLKDELGSKGKRQREVPATSFFDFKRREQSKSSRHINRERSPDDYGGTTSRDGFASNSADPNEKDPLCNSYLTLSRNSAVERMKLIMEENGFYYLPPRVQKRTDGYLHYKRKRLDGKLICVAHADYYIVLRACAKVAQVDMRMMHLGVLKFERRLAWIEQRIDSSLNTLPQLLHQMQDN
ncbi:hypothetical protein GW17_00036761 [Ensete ventricosum]|nr:hypothetical protein GW17_00036761 [Ensete ventricosum]